MTQKVIDEPKSKCPYCGTNYTKIIYTTKKYYLMECQLGHRDNSETKFKIKKEIRYDKR